MWVVSCDLWFVTHQLRHPTLTPPLPFASSRFSTLFFLLFLFFQRSMATGPRKQSLSLFVIFYKPLKPFHLFLVSAIFSDTEKYHPFSRCWRFRGRTIILRPHHPFSRCCRFRGRTIILRSPYLQDDKTDFIF